MEWRRCPRLADRREASEFAMSMVENTLETAPTRYEKAKAKLTSRDRWAHANPRDARLKRALDKLVPKALHQLSVLAFQQEDQQVSLGACREILDRGIGKPKQHTTTDISIVHSADAHVAALLELARMARASGQIAAGQQPQIIDAHAQQAPKDD